MYKSKLATISFLILVSFVLSATAFAQTGAQRPKGTAKGIPAAKKVPTPKNWTYMYESKKGYGFYLPSGSTTDFQKVKGIDVFTAQTPAPSDVTVIVLAYKDKTLTKDDLLDDAVDFIEGMGDTIETGTLTAESEDYAIADAVTTDANGNKTKMRILVGTDVTDNYIMFVGTDASKFEANKNIVDAIWGSFEMWSGGASGKN